MPDHGDTKVCGGVLVNGHNPNNNTSWKSWYCTHCRQDVDDGCWVETIREGQRCEKTLYFEDGNHGQYRGWYTRQYGFILEKDLVESK